MCPSQAPARWQCAMGNGPAGILIRRKGSYSRTSVRPSKPLKVQPLALTAGRSLRQVPGNGAAISHARHQRAAVR